MSGFKVTIIMTYKGLVFQITPSLKAPSTRHVRRYPPVAQAVVETERGCTFDVGTPFASVRGPSLALDKQEKNTQRLLQAKHSTDPRARKPGTSRCLRPQCTSKPRGGDSTYST